MKKFVFSTILIFAVTLIFSACGSVSKKPDFVLGEIPFFCGVGEKPVGGKAAEAQAHKEARNAARIDIAKNLESYITGIAKQGDSTYQDGSQIDVESLGKEAARIVYNNTVNFARQIAGGEWTTDGVQYVAFLYCIPSEKVQQEFEDVMNHNAKIPEQKRQKMINDTNNMLKEADEIIAGYRSNSPVMIPSGQQE